MQNGLQVFLAHASEDKEKVRQLRDKLKSEGLKTWFDEDDIEGGVLWPEEIPKAIKNSDIFLACLSKNSVKKVGYLQKELRLALVAYSERPAGEIYLIPVKLDDCETPSLQISELGIDLKHFQHVDLSKKDGYERLLRAIRKTTAERQKHFSKKKKSEEHELKPEQWKGLEKAVRDIAATAGFAAMGYYRNALAESSALTACENPSTIADENATIATLQRLYSHDSLFADLGYEYRVFAEELDSEEVAPRILEKLQGNPIFPRVKTSTKEFRKDWDRSISILIDAIDGTVNFDANLPFFCSAVAIFIGGRLSVGAIYDPFHNQVYYGSLRVLKDGQRESVANVWSIHAGNLDEFGGKKRTNVKRKLIATHITRSDQEARNRFLKFLPSLYKDKALNGGTYMLNCGQMALAHVACGNLSAFLNNTTGIWDVAAGEVLIRATGGKITDFKGREIDYGESSRVSVLGCKTTKIHDSISKIINRSYPWDK